MNVLQNKYVNKKLGGFNVALVPVTIGSVTTIAVVLLPMVGFALTIVAAVMAPMVMYGAYHQVAGALQNLRSGMAAKKSAKVLSTQKHRQNSRSLLLVAIQR